MNYLIFNLPEHEVWIRNDAKIIHSFVLIIILIYMCFVKKYTTNISHFFRKRELSDILQI